MKVRLPLMWLAACCLAMPGRASPTPGFVPHLGPGGLPVVHAAAAVVLDANTGSLLFQKNPDARRSPPAPRSF